MNLSDLSENSMSAHLLVTEIVASDRLQGRSKGRHHFSRICEAISRLHRGDLVRIDFSNTAILSASWINEAIIPLMRWASDPRNDLFPVLWNIESLWIDELELVAEWAKVNFICSNTDLPSDTAYLLGDLDDRQKATLNSVQNSNGVTGAGLERLRIEEGIKATAWNNRLKDLFDRRLIRRKQRGREQVYHPVVPRLESWRPNSLELKKA